MKNETIALEIIKTNINSKGEGIHVLPHAEFVTKFVQKYIDYSAGAEVDIPLCTYTNESAINYNSMVRKAAYFLEDTMEPFYPGERLIANSVVMESEKIILTNNETVHVMGYEDAEYEEIPGYLVTVRGDFCEYLKTDVKKVFSPITPTAANRVLAEYKKQAIREKDKSHWVHYYGIKNALASAEEARKEMQNLQSDNERLIKEARAERDEMMKDARNITDNMIAAAKEDAKEVTATLIEKAQASINQEKQAALAEIKKTVAELSIGIAETVIKKELSSKDDQLKLVEGMLEEVTLN